MNHYDPLIQDFLAQNRSVTFEKIGHITIGGSGGIGPKGVVFQYDKKATTSQELIDFIAERTGKNKFLIQSDLESHFELTRQFINIGKPYELEGFGFISLSKSGEYIFTPYEAAERKEEHKVSKKKQQAYNIMHEEPKRSSKSFLMFVAFLIIVGILGVIGWGTYKLFIEQGIGNMNDTLATSNIVTPTDTANTVATKDTATVLTNTDTATLVKNDTSTYKFFFDRTYSLDRANNRIDMLRIILTDDAYFDSLKTDSTTLYRLYLKLKLPSADTTKMKDSLQRYFKHSIKIVPL
jgi:hypothetical protein